jgi:hypothetical protein
MLVQGMNRLVILLPLYLLQLKPKMQYGKLFVVFGHLHSEENAVYCTSNVRNNVDSAVINC